MILWIFVFIQAFALAETPNPKMGITCEEVLKDKRALTIYRVVDEKPDARGDRALWQTFKLKVFEKVPAILGDWKLVKRNQEYRSLPFAERERILQCFHGPNYRIPKNERNKIESSYPLLDFKDQNPDNLFATVVDEEKLDLTDLTENVTKVLGALENGSGMDPNCADQVKGFESEANPIKPEAFETMFKSIICPSGIKPQLGKPDKWHKDFTKGMPAPPISKLLVALANGDTNRILPTAKESDLMNWVLDQKTRSVTIHGIIQKSYQLNQGDLYKTFLTIENVLSEDYYVRGRERLTMTTKLSRIINHRGGQFDLFGPWYHFFGMMTYGYAEGSEMKANVMGFLEKGTTLFHKGGTEFQENHMIQGGVIGAKLKKQIKRIKTDQDLARYCEGSKASIAVSDYLDLETYEAVIPSETSNQVTTR